jgi:hypothetical protein
MENRIIIIKKIPNNNVKLGYPIDKSKPIAKQIILYFGFNIIKKKKIEKKFKMKCDGSEKKLKNIGKSFPP